MEGFSIIICTYNPDRAIFQRLLNAVVQFDISSREHEVIIVDNNSLPALAEDKDVHQFLQQNENAKLIREPKPGLTAARIAGIEKAKYDWIIFFDDDNEPSSDYLTEASKVINQYPHVGAWGPGTIKVRFIDKKVSVFLNNQRILFQERQMDKVEFDNNLVEGNVCYPYGTGLIMKAIVLHEYMRGVKENKLTMTDRNAGSFTSGGDSQMLYVALKMGYFAGSSPSIKLTHNILPSKLKLSNILKLVYFTNAGQIKAYNEVFADHPYQIRCINSGMLYKSIFEFLKQFIKRPLKLKYALVNFSKKLGMMKAQIIAGDQKNPWLLLIWEKIINAKTS